MKKKQAIKRKIIARPKRQSTEALDWIELNMLAERLGGAPALASRLEQEGLKRSLPTVRRWLKKPGTGEGGRSAKKPTDFEMVILKKIRGASK